MTQQRRACDSCSRKKILCDGDEGDCDWCRHHGLRCTFDRHLKKRMASAAGYASTSSFKKRIERLEVALNEAQDKLGSIRENTGSPQQHQQQGGHGETGNSKNTSGNKNTYTFSTPSSAWKFKNSAQIFNLGRFHLGGHHIGSVSSTSCLPVFSPVGQEWVQAATGEIPSFDKLRMYDADWNGEQDGSSNMLSRSPSSSAFPARHLVETQWATYLANNPYRVFPVLEPTRFARLIQQTYDPPAGLSRVHTEIARASVLAFSALATIMQGAVDMPHVPGTDEFDAEAFGTMAADSLAYLLQEPGVDQCSALITLAVFHTLSGHEFQGAMLLSMACRSLLVLGAHSMSPNNPLPPLTQNSTNNTGADEEEHRSRTHLRQIFWLAYSMDKEMSLRSGLGPAFSDEFCDLTPPMIPGLALSRPQQSIDHYHQPKYDEQGRRKLDARFLPPSLAQSLMKSRICRLLYSEAALHKMSAETLRDIRLLDDELEEWRLSMPAEWRPSLGPPGNPSSSAGSSATSSSASSPGSGNDQGGNENADNTSSHGNTQQQQQPAQQQNPHAVMSKLAYYHLVSVVHRASGRCRAMNNDSNSNSGNGGQQTEDMSSADTLGAGISSSLAISVQASRMTIYSLRESWGATSSYAFWVIVFYPISAVLAIFCHILLDPISPTVLEDLALIGAVPEIVRNLGTRRRQHHVRDDKFYRVVDELCAELIRLGNCAVYRAVERQMCELMS